MRRQSWVGALLVMGIPTTACQREATRGGGPLPAMDARLPAQDSVQNPFVEIAPGVFSRVVYRSTESRPHRIEVRDLEIARGKMGDGLTFPGAAVIEVRSGKGSLRVGAKAQEIQAGATLGISQGDSLRLANRDSGPLSLRVYVIGARE